MIKVTHIIKLVVFVVALFFSVATFVYATESVGSERIREYTVDVTILRDGTFQVSEIIDYDFGNKQRHGIYRYIPTDHPQKDRNLLFDRYVDIALQDVAMTDMEVQYAVEKEKDQLFVRIGDPDATITGAHAYVLSYRVTGGLSHYADGTAEFYWDAVGAEWSVPIDAVKVTLHDSDGVFMAASACYKGVKNTSDSCDSASSEGTSVIFEAKHLRPNEGVTIAQSINPRAVEHVVLERKKVEFFWIPALLIWFMVLSWFTYQYRTHYKLNKPVIARYEPYGTTKPMYTGLLFDGRLDPRDITAGILYLAEQGYLKIKKTDEKVMFFFEVDDYEVTLLQPIEKLSSEFQTEVLKLLFGENPTTGTTIKLNDLKGNTTKQRKNKKILHRLKKALERDLKEVGFFEVHMPYYQAAIISSVVVSIGAFFMWIKYTPAFSSVWFIGLGIIGSTIILFSVSRRRTTKGYEALLHLKGFKEFLSVTEKERYTFHNAPEKSPEQFMEYLPYAIAFGVEKKWAEVFEDISIPNPSWYEGDTHFSAIGFSQSIGSFSTALASSSGSSASSGGGSVGGGGGGGGGGSW